MRHACFAAFLILLAGCAAYEPVYLANGQRVVRVTCAVAVDRMTSCFTAAGNICGPRGFVLYNWDGDAWAKPYPDPDILQNDPGLAASGLLVACRS
jgi:hypothetical protein